MDHRLSPDEVADLKSSLERVLADARLDAEERDRARRLLRFVETMEKWDAAHAAAIAAN